MLSIFFPIRYGNTFFIKKTIVSIYFTPKRILAILVVANGLERRILKTAALDIDIQETQNDILSSVLSKLIENWEYDFCRLIFSSNIVIFKTIVSPFNDLEKIKMTTPFELESLLPFPLSEASVDVVFQDKDLNKEKNLLLAVISKEETIEYYREIFKNAHLKIDSITVDAVELLGYDLTFGINNNHIVMYNNNSGITIFFYNSQGLVTLKYIDLKIPMHDGLFDQNKSSESDDIFYVLNQILSSLSQEHNFPLEGAILYILGIDLNHTLIKKLVDMYKFSLQNYIENKINFHNILIKFDQDKGDLFFADINNQFLLLSVLFLYKNDFFSLAHQENTDYKNKILLKQIIMTFILTILFFVIQIAWNVFNLVDDNKTLEYAEKQVIQVLKKEFDLPTKYLYSIDKAYQESEKIVNELEENLPIIATTKKFLFIDLMSTLNKNLFNDINQLVIYEIKWKLGIKESSMLGIIGEVKDFDGLRLFEESLKKTNLFSFVPQEQDLRFNFNLHLI